ncbi:MAG TPA: cytochrome c oxidase subunit I [Microthrixaceae bacterium]|nr:cytochrome c oxidase subunit I [Microthrixaceae bacterium]
MAIVEEHPPLELNAGATTVTAPDLLGVFGRPKATTGWRSWVNTVDHKKIGIMYGAVSFFFLLVGGFEALLIRAQLAVPGSQLLSADLYNQVFTMHGLTMIFLVVMPMASAFANFLIPLQIGARDVAFPRMNALSLWIWVLGAVFFNTSWLFGGGADGGWFNYAPNSGVTFSPGYGIDFYAVGLLIIGVGSTVSAINLTVTVLNMRAPGMTLMKMPVFTWMAFITQVLLVFALPAITVALILLMLSRLWGATFFDPSMGGDPMLWQHMFWIFGHPEVYIMVIPAFGMVSEIIPVFSRKPIFGYPFMVGSGIAIGFMGFGVWAHHMFASGMGQLSVLAFSMATMFIAVPTGVKVLNWLATMYGGRLRFTVAMLFSMGMVGMFTIGGLSGVSHAFASADTQQTDTYYIIAHFHYVLFGGALLTFFGGMYFWWPKAFGHMLSEKLGKWNFWLMFIGFNLTFGPMHILGLQGMMRRTYTYTKGQGFETWNMVSTIGAFMIAVSIIIFIVNIAMSYSKHKRNPVDPGPDPWDSRSLEWMIPSPSPEHNFDEIPVVEELDEFWHRKYGHDEEGHLVRIARTEDVVQRGDATGVHLPSPSYWPLVLAAGFPFIGYGIIFNLAWAVPGALLLIAGMAGWVMEPSTEPDHGDSHDDGQPSLDSPDSAAAELPEADAEGEDDTAKLEGSDELVGASASSEASAKTGDDSND